MIYNMILNEMIYTHIMMTRRNGHVCVFDERCAKQAKAHQPDCDTNGLVYVDNTSLTYTEKKIFHIHLTYITAINQSI
jgi:hypothetical protein